MDYTTPIQIALALLSGILTQYKVGGAAQEIIAGIESSIAELTKAHGQEVTLGTLEALRVPIPQWATPKQDQ